MALESRVEWILKHQYWEVRSPDQKKFLFLGTASEIQAWASKKWPGCGYQLDEQGHPVFTDGTTVVAHAQVRGVPGHA